ncbi:MAG TPA: hypothetical protein VHJ20_12255 [Polyangia bacterium]|nr:hypothetical protein [Polyangia bacterium]
MVTTLDVTLDPDRGPLFGRAHLQIHNTSNATLPSVPLWLYPNHLAERPASLGDVNYHWLYPGLFSPGGMEIGDVHVDGVATEAPTEDTEAGPRTLARVKLPHPLPPGDTTTIEVAFEVKLPRRFGGFGCLGTRCRLMGGFYPTPAHLGAGGWELAAAPDRTQARVTVRAPAELTLVVDGELQPRRGAEAVTVTSADVPYATIVSEPVLRDASLDAAAVHVDYLHRKERPPSSEDQPLPYVREDVPGLVLAAARDALEFLAAQGLSTHATPRLTMVEAPLRHELVQVHGDLILVSDQIFGIFPVSRVRKYHRFELVRAVLTAVVGDALGAAERPDDRDLAAGVLAAYLMDVFTLHDAKKIEFARDLLRPFDFIPAVDQLMYAPLVASSSTYFGDIDDADPVRDDVRRFAHKNASPRLVYSKLMDLLGPAGMTRLPRLVLGEGKPFRAAAAEIFAPGAGPAALDWFWAQWLGPRPRVNYRLVGVRVTPRGAGVHVAVDLAREGEAVREPVEVRVDDRGGGTRTLTWAATATEASTTLEADLPAGLKSVEIDPRGRLVETAVGSLRASDDPRYDNREPRRWRLIYEGFGALLNVTQLTAAFEAAFALKPQYDLRHAILFRAFHSEATTIGIGGGYDWFFGRQADRNHTTSAIGAGLTASRLDPSFGVALGEKQQPGYRIGASVGLAHDTRDYLIDPWMAVAFNAGVSSAVTALEDGTTLTQVGAGVEALRLFELLPGHVLGIDVSASAQFGDLRLRSQLTAAGGVDGLRGYQLSDLLARANAIGRIQLRDDYITDLNWDLLHFTTVRTLAGTLFADAAAISSCDGYGFSKDRVFTDVGYSFRALHDAFGVYQQLFSIDVAFPLTSRPAGDTCFGHALATLPRGSLGWHNLGQPTVLVTFLPNF